MFLLRTSRQTRAIFRSAASTRAPAPVSISKRFSSSDYGSGTHNNEPNSSVDKEHPGPPPPKAAQSNSKRKEVTPDSDSSGSSSSSSSSTSTTSSSKSAGGAQPKILNESPPRSGEEPEDVRRHNEEIKNRADRPHENVKDDEIAKDKVSKDFWAGQGGRDRDP